MYSEDSSGLYTHASWIPPLQKNTEVLTFHPPLQWLPFPATVGAKWTVGDYEDHGNRVHITGEILGMDDVAAPAGKFSQCLKVRYLKQTKGTIVIQNRKTPASLDLEEMIWWFAPGVGPVRQVNTVKIGRASCRERV